MSDERKMICREFAIGGLGGNGKDELRVSLQDLIESLQGALDRIPEPHRSTAMIEINGYGDYAHVSVDGYYFEPESDAQYSARLLEEQAERNRSFAETQLRELAELERLKKKYQTP